jgi:hypothetical protein
MVPNHVGDDLSSRVHAPLQGFFEQTIERCVGASDRFTIAVEGKIEQS